MVYYNLQKGMMKSNQGLAYGSDCERYVIKPIYKTC